MNASERSYGSSGPFGGPALREPRPGVAGVRPGSLYIPTWWERRFPWLLDALAALDPAPLGRWLVFPLLPFRAVIEALSRPLAAVLDLAGRGIGAVGSGLSRAVGAAVAALPLPAFARRALWLPMRSGESHPLGAQLALRRQHAIVLPLALLVAAGTHASVMIYAPPFSAPDFTSLSEEITAIELPPEIEIPPPPRQIARPATPIIASAQVDEDLTIAPTTFDDYAVRDLPPPPSPAADENQRQPSFTPFTVPPRILNTDLIEELMATAYPQILRDARIAGRVVVWVYLDRNGLVEDVRVAESSGYPAMDDAGLSVARRIRATPALNRDVTIAVWVQIPLEFVIR